MLFRLKLLAWSLGNKVATQWTFVPGVFLLAQRHFFDYLVFDDTPILQLTPMTYTFSKVSTIPVNFS